MENYSDEQLVKLRNYLIENAKTLASQNRIRRIREYPDREHLRDYYRTIIDVEVLGQVEIYITNDSKILKVNDVYASREQVEKLDFYGVLSILYEAYTEQKAKDAGKWFDSI